MQDFISDEQMKKLEQQGKAQAADFIPDAKAATQPQPKKSGFFNTLSRFGQNVQDIGVGAAKGFAHTVTSSANLIQKAGNFGGDVISAGLGIKNRAPQPTKPSQLVPSSVYTPKNTAEKVGFGAEQVGEFFVPGGATAKATKAAEAGIDALRTASYAKKFLKLGAAAGISAAEMGGMTAAQGGSKQDVSNAAKLGALFTVGGKAVEAAANKALPALARKIEEINLRLTPVQKRNLSKHLDDVTDFLAKQKLVGTPEARFNKVDAIYNKTEDQLQSVLKTYGENRAVAKEPVIQHLNELKSKFMNDADVLAIEKQIDQAITTLQTRYPSKIPLTRLNELKRSVYKNAYNLAGNKVRDDVEHAIGDVYKTQIEKALDGVDFKGISLKAFNKTYGTIIQARKLLGIAKSRNEIGFMGRLLSAAIGGAIGSAAGPGIGTAIGIGAGELGTKVIAGTPARSLMGAAVQTAREIPFGKIADTAKRVITPLLPRSKPSQPQTRRYMK